MSPHQQHRDNTRVWIQRIWTQAETVLPPRAGHTGTLPRHTLHTLTSESQPASMGNLQTEALSFPCHMSCGHTDLPATGSRDAHAQTRLAIHQHNPHRHTQRHQPHTQTHPVTKTQPMLVPRLLPGTRVIPTRGEAWRESDGDAPGHTQTPRACPRGENGATGHP